MRTKVIKRGLLLTVMLVFGLGIVRSALADDSSEQFPADGTYSFALVGANVNTTTDVPTTAMSGVFKVTGGSTTFAVSKGNFILNDDRKMCTGGFAGTGTPNAAGVNSGTMALTLSGLGGGANCDVLSVNGTGTPTALTLYYGVSSLGGNPDFFPSNSVIYLEVIDQNSVALVGEASKQ